jgi:hypothetical protein
MDAVGIVIDMAFSSQSVCELGESEAEDSRSRRGIEQIPADQFFDNFFCIEESL